jgi:4-hydroxythreonine-4-phosphate dehydrogenase
MIHITQGHEESISIEVLLKALLLIHSNQTKNHLILHAFKETLEKNASLLNLSIEFNGKFVSFCGHQVQFIELAPASLPQSTSSLLSALNSIQQEDILITLPTTKDQLILDKKNPLGHTEFLRQFYKRPDLPMFFYAEDLKVLLLTDHIPLSDVTKAIQAPMVIDKVQTCIDGYLEYFSDIDDIIFAGVNPHAGEGGLLGHQENELKQAIRALSASNPGINFLGPIPGDSAHTKLNHGKKQIIVYSFHDQGLPYFKATQNFFGINTTFGLPFLRLSPDHGTALELWGKNKANALGFHDVLLRALTIGHKNGNK